jgi:hypothetical protein
MMTRLNDAISATRARLLGLGLMLLAVLPAAGQLVVYEMDFKRTDGFNDRPFLGGYFVAPVTGGTGSFVFAQRGTSGVAVVPVNDGGRLFRSVTDDGEVNWVAQGQVGGTTTDETTDGETTDTTDTTDTTTDTGTVSVSTGSFLAVGRAGGNVGFRTPLVRFETRIAKTLEGRTIAASSEAINESDKRIGFVSRGDWKLKYDEKQTGIVNRDDLDLAAATDYLEGLMTAGAVGPVDSTLRIISTSPLTQGTVGTAYSLQLNGAGGTGTRTWSLASSSTLPAGLTLSSAGLISGTPTAAGTTSFSVLLQDGSSPPLTTSRTFSLTINPAFVISTASPLPAGTKDVAYATVNLDTDGERGVVTYSVVTVVGQSLPPGISLVGVQIVGTPTVSGTYNFTIRADDAGPPAGVATKVFQLVVNDPP